MKNPNRHKWDATQIVMAFLLGAALTFGVLAALYFFTDALKRGPGDIWAPPPSVQEQLDRANKGPTLLP